MRPGIFLFPFSQIFIYRNNKTKIQIEMKVNINGKEFELKKTMRSIILYEAITKTSFQPKNTTDMVFYFYSCLLAVAGSQCGITLDDFIDWLDNNEGALGEFSEWLIKVNDIEEQVIPESKKKGLKSGKH